MNKYRPNQQGNLAIVLSILVVLAVLGRGAYYYLNPSQKPNEQSSLQLMPSPTKTTPALTKTSNIPTDWKTYTDPLKTYTFKYPKEWVLVSERTNLEPSNLVLESSDFVISQPSMGGGYIPGAKQGIKFEIAQGTNANFTNYEQLKEFYETKYSSYPKNFFNAKKEIQIDNIQAMIELGGKADFGGIVDRAYFINNNLLYDINFTTATNQDALFEQILSTFIFTK